MVVALETFVISQPILKQFLYLGALNKGHHLDGKKNTNTTMDGREKLRNVLKAFRMQSYLNTGGCIISEKLECHSCPEGLIYKRLLAIVEKFLLPCMICIEKI